MMKIEKAISFWYAVFNNLDVMYKFGIQISNEHTKIVQEKSPPHLELILFCSQI